MERTSKSSDVQFLPERLGVKQRVSTKRAEKIIGTVLVHPESRIATEKKQQRSNRLETIGHVLVSAESEAKRGRTATERILANKRAEAMGRDELLHLSETIIVDGTSLRDVYETHLISEKGLRRLIAEHLAGGNVARMLRRELIEREIDFERDPQLRDRARQSVTGAGSGKQALHSLLASAGAQPIQDQIAVQKSKPVQRDATPSTRRKPQALVDVLLGAIILVLASLVTYLLLRGSQ
jgi:hypothetical protein